MKIYDGKNSNGEFIYFEIPNTFLSRKVAIKIIKKIPNVEIIEEEIKDDAFCIFKLGEKIFEIMEPFGDNSRYHIGEKVAQNSNEIKTIRQIFLDYKPKRKKMVKKIIWFLLGILLLPILMVIYVLMLSLIPFRISVWLFILTLTLVLAILVKQRKQNIAFFVGLRIFIIGFIVLLISLFLLDGMVSYSRMMEKARQDEAKYVLKELRTICVAAFENLKNLDSAIESTNKKIIDDKNIPGPGPNNCISTNSFYYSLKKTDNSKVAFIATRCISNGKVPQGVKAYNLKLITDCSTGEDTWETP